MDPTYDQQIIEKKQGQKLNIFSLVFLLTKCHFLYISATKGMENNKKKSSFGPVSSSPILTVE